MDRQEYICLRALLSIEGIGPTRVRNLLAAFSSFQQIFSASRDELARVEMLSNELAKKIIRQKELFNEIETAIDKEDVELGRQNARVISFLDDDYPFLLKKIYDPPLLLYAAGDAACLRKSCIAVIGTRMPSPYGKSMTEKICAELTNAGLTIVSGFARGIDTIAHTTALANGGSTAAVLGSGIDVIYPSENKKLVEKLTKNGVLLSEYPPGTKPDAMNFPRRNRIISGLSKAVFVVETRQTGGAMITAKIALDQGRDVFALPGNVGIAPAEGTNFLIKSSLAKLITSHKDILEEMGITQESAREAKHFDVSQLNLFEAKIFNALSDTPVQIDQLAATTGLPVSDCLVHLLGLEFKSIARQLPGKMFIRNE